MTKQHFDNETGIIYGYLMLALAVGVMAILWLAFSYNINMILTVFFNPAIQAGTVSAQTQNNAIGLVNAFTYAPVAILILAFVWAVRRATYIREGGQ